MGEDGGGLYRDRNARNQNDGGAAVRTPSDTGSGSSSDVPLDGAPTIVPDSEASDSDAPTLLDGLRVSPVHPPTPVGAASPAPRPKSQFPTQGLPVPQPVFDEGTVLSGRYQIVQTLGEGGMGAVYKAQDLALDRLVALKVIRPELARNPAIIDRFKQELLLSQRVTHRNVIRIYDLGEGDGVKFITMEYIEGQDLRSLIRERKKLPPIEVVGIMQQVCLALDAAHSVGVIHRDLKPQNVMIEPTGRVLVMDFGLARRLEGDGMTQSGALVGTMEYMSPEQALGKTLDQRSDLFSAGLICYELLTGQMPFRAESALASLIRRTQERALPISDVDASIPANLTAIVSRCLERDLNLRYQSAQELLADLEGWQGKAAAATLQFRHVGRWAPSAWPWISLVVAVAILATVGIRYRGLLFPNTAQPAASKPALSLAILPFRNGSGDSSLDWLGPSLADMLSTDVGQSARLRTVSPTSLHQILSDLHITSTTTLDPAMLRRVADFSNADRVVWGQYAKFGDQIRIDATVQDIKNDRMIPLKVDVPSEREIPSAVDRLAESIREKLALPEDVLKELKASSFQPTSQSMDALRDYNQGVELQRDGRILEAQKHFAEATKQDPAFALAFSRLAQAYSSLGYDNEAEQSAKEAVTLSQNLPEAEKYLISATELQVVKNYSAAIKAYQNLETVSPDNSDVKSALASLYQDSGELAKARDYYQQILASNPKDVGATLNLGRIEIKSGNAQGSFESLNRAYSLAVQVGNDEQKATSLHLMAVAYRMLDKPQEVLRNEQDAIAIWRQIGQKRGLGFSLNETARAEASLGKYKAALDNFQEALQIRRQIGDKRGLGDTLIDLGNFYDDRGDRDQALKMYKDSLQLQRDLGNEGLQAICLNNIGSVYSDKGQYEDALTYFQQALQLREKSKVPQDIVDAVHNLGFTSAAMGQYDQAISYYLRALDLRRSMNDPQGAAIESYGLGVLFDYQGRFGAAINSTQEALKTLRDAKDKTQWMARVLNGFANALILAGRGDEAKSSLDESLSLSRELKNDEIVAEALGYQGDAQFYRGDFKSARALYAEALPIATRSKQPDAVLIARAKLAKVQVEEKTGEETIADLRKLILRADDLGLKYDSVECSISVAEAMMRSHDYSHARQEMARALLLADKLGMQPLSARAHYLLATIERESGNSSDAQVHYREALRLLDVMKKDPGAEKLLQRADLNGMYEESTRRAQAAKN